MADYKSFKKLISAMESSDNPDVKHPPVKKGVNKGDTAIGQYGLMPNTIRELANRAEKSGQETISDDIIQSSSNLQIEDMLKNRPELMDLYVNRLMKHVMDKSKNNPEEAYLRWLYGHNLPDNRIQRLKKSDDKTMKRMRDIINTKHLMSEQPDLLQIPEEPFVDKPYSPKKSK